MRESKNWERDREEEKKDRGSKRKYQWGEEGARGCVIRLKELGKSEYIDVG